jgi:hypothetical protein
MSRATKCDACGKRLRKNHHELLLRDLLTGQVIGHYHAGLAWSSCRAQAAKYTKPSSTRSVTEGRREPAL